MSAHRMLLLLFLILWILSIQQSNAQFIYTKGRNVYLPDGKPFIIRGTNLGNWLVPEGYMFLFRNTNSPRLISEGLNELIGPANAKNFWKKYLDSFITEADIHFLKSIGMNSIRIPFNYRLFTNENYLGENNDQHGFVLLDKLINWCKRENLYVILDMHCAPGGQTGDNIDDGFGFPFLFDNEADQQLTINIWKRIAEHYKNEPIIIGYDLLNEPIAHYFDKQHFNPLLEPLYKKIGEAIRTVDKNHLLILGGAQWDSNFEPFGKPFDSKIIYTFHKYWTSPTQKVIQDYINFSNKYNVPIYCGETGENTDQWVDSFRITLENANIGWHFWPYKKLESARGVVQVKKPLEYDSIIHFMESPRGSFAAIRKARKISQDEASRILNEFINNCRFVNCLPNTGYIKALGFKSQF